MESRALDLSSFVEKDRHLPVTFHAGHGLYN
jgi:hypothetical protein